MISVIFVTVQWRGFKVGAANVRSPTYNLHIIQDQVKKIYIVWKLINIKIKVQQEVINITLRHKFTSFKTPNC